MPVSPLQHRRAPRNPFSGGARGAVTLSYNDARYNNHRGSPRTRRHGGSSNICCGGPIGWLTVLGVGLYVVYSLTASPSPSEYSQQQQHLQTAGAGQKSPLFRMDPTTTTTTVAAAPQVRAPPHSPDEPSPSTDTEEEEELVMPSEHDDDYNDDSSKDPKHNSPDQTDPPEKTNRPTKHHLPFHLNDEPDNVVWGQDSYDDQQQQKVDDGGDDGSGADDNTALEGNHTTTKNVVPNVTLDTADDGGGDFQRAWDFTDDKVGDANYTVDEDAADDGGLVVGVDNEFAQDSADDGGIVREIDNEFANGGYEDKDGVSDAVVETDMVDDGNNLTEANLDGADFDGGDAGIWDGAGLGDEGVLLDAENRTMDGEVLPELEQNQTEIAAVQKLEETSGIQKGESDENKSAVEEKKETVDEIDGSENTLETKDADKKTKAADAANAAKEVTSTPIEADNTNAVTESDAEETLEPKLDETVTSAPTSTPDLKSKQGDGGKADDKKGPTDASEQTADREKSVEKTPKAKKAKDDKKKKGTANRTGTTENETKIQSDPKKQDETKTTSKQEPETPDDSLQKTSDEKKKKVKNDAPEQATERKDEEKKQKKGNKEKGGDKAKASDVIEAEAAEKTGKKKEKENQ